MVIKNFLPDLIFNRFAPHLKTILTYAFCPLCTKATIDKLLLKPDFRFSSPKDKDFVEKRSTHSNQKNLPEKLSKSQDASLEMGEDTNIPENRKLQKIFRIRIRDKSI